MPAPDSGVTTRSASLALAMLVLSSGAHGGNTCPPPKQALVCDNGKVSKGKLANYALDACGVMTLPRIRIHQEIII